MSKEVEMNIYDLEKKMEEFNFLSDFLSEKEEDKILNFSAIRDGDVNLINPEYIKVKRVDENLMKIIPCINYWGGNSCNMEYDQYIAVIGNDTVMLDCWEEHDIDVRSIGEQLYSKNLFPDYIINIKRKEEGYDLWVKVIIYKMKDFDLVNYHADEFEKRSTEQSEENYVYRMIISNFHYNTIYNDDMYGEEVVFNEFKYSDLFGDFRIFNGIKLKTVDIYLHRLANIMNALNEEGGQQ